MKNFLKAIFKEVANTFKVWYLSLNTKSRLAFWISCVLILIYLICSLLGYPKQTMRDTRIERFLKPFPGLTKQSDQLQESPNHD